MIEASRRSRRETGPATRPTLPIRLAVNLPIALALVLLLLLRLDVIRTHRVSSVNMMPTLELDDRVMVRAYGREPARGDVVVYRSPFDPEHLQIGRIVGVPGDQLSLDERGLTLDGRSVAIRGGCDGRACSGCPGNDCPPECEGSHCAEAGCAGTQCLIGAETIGGHRFYTRRADGIPALHFASTSVPEGHYFVLSDNRVDERDSRIYGAIPHYAVVGVLSFVYYASDETGIRWDRISRPVS